MRFWRGWLIWLTAGCLLAALPALLTPELSLLVGGAESRPDLVTVLRGGSAALLLCCGVWWWAAATAVLVAAGRGRLTRPRGCPRWLHRALLGVLGAVVAGGLATPALALDPPTSPTVGVEVLRGLPYPDRAEDPPALAHPRGRQAAARTAPPTASRHVVVPGDTLWALAVRDLPEGASAAGITTHWHRIYRRNRAAIGPDPDLLVPGTSLVLPSPREETR